MCAVCLYCVCTVSSRCMEWSTHRDIISGEYKPTVGNIFLPNSFESSYLIQHHALYECISSLETMFCMIFKTKIFTSWHRVTHCSSLYKRWLLRSAVGKTHNLRSDLWWTIPLHILLDRFGIPFGFHAIKSALARHSGVQVPVISRHEGHVVTFGTFHILPTGLHGLCFGFCFAGPLPLRSLSHGPLSRFHFGESLVNRLYSEIDHIHLSSEAQCVSHHLPLVDCHSRGLPSLVKRLSDRLPPRTSGSHGPEC